MTTVRRSIPTNITPLTVEQRIAKAAKKAELAAAAAVEVDGRVDDVLAGDEAFTGLLVGSDDKVAFLTKVDAGALADSTGLDDGVVPTAAMAVDAITSEASAFTADSLDVTGTSEITVQTVDYTTTGETIEVRANFFLTVWHPTAGNVNATVRIYRGATMIYEQTFPAINGDLLQGWMTPVVIEQPTAGAYTYTVKIQVDVSNTSVADASSRLLSVREFKR